MEPGYRMHRGSWMLRDRLQQMGLTLPQILSEIKSCEEMENRTKWERDHQTEREVRAPSSGSTFLSKCPFLSGLWFPQWPRKALPSSPMLIPDSPDRASCKHGENSVLVRASQSLRAGSPHVQPGEQTTCGHMPIWWQKGRELPGVAVGGEALPGLHAAAGHGKGAPTAAVQLHEQGLGRILSCLPAVVSTFEHLSDVLIPGLVSYVAKRPKD